jgi:hypothetical protein
MKHAALLQEEVMPVSKMSPEEVDAYVKKRREDKLDAFDTIARDLAKIGVVSERTRKPYTAVTLKLRYHKSVAMQTVAGNSQDRQKLDMIKKFLGLKAPDSQKLNLIESVVEED